MSRSKTYRTKPCPCGDYAIGPKLYAEGWEDGHMTKCPKMTLDGYLAVMASRAPSKKEGGAP